MINRLLLIDNNIPDINTILKSLLPFCDFIIFDFKHDSIHSIINTIIKKQYISVGLLQENYETNHYQLFNSSQKSIVKNVQTEDSELNTWIDFRNLLVFLKHECKITDFDIISCNINSNNDWNYITNYITNETNIIINSSKTKIGCKELGGNWILESSNENMIGKYFTENIENYNFVLGPTSNHSLLLDNSNNIWAFGSNEFGQLGLNNFDINIFSPTKLNYFSDNNIHLKYFSTGANHSLFLDISGNVWSCGKNDYGQLGLDNSNNTIIPENVTTINNIIAISAGKNHSLFLDNNGDVWVCGSNLYGQLGFEDNINNPPIEENASIDFNNIPIKLTTLSNIIAICAGADHSLFLDSSGEVWSCGLNSEGQLGLQDNNNRNIPEKITNLTNITNVFCGSNHSLFLDTNYDTWCCGANISGQLGLNNNNTNINIPEKITSLANIKYINAGLNHTLFLDSSQNVWSCGLNNYGQLGLGNNSPNIPTKINNLNSIVSISCGLDHSLFLDINKIITSCGNNQFGQLGFTNNVTNLIIPFLLPENNITNFANGKIIKLPENKKSIPIILPYELLTKMISDPPFEISPPISNSNGSFSYTISDEETISINENIVTILNMGIVRITATQEETSDHTMGIIQWRLEINPNPLIEQPIIMTICFPAKTPVQTDQGKIYIDKLIPGYHTIKNKSIKCITKNILPEKCLVYIKKNALGKNVPSENTLISRNHKVMYNNKMVPAKNLVDLIDRVKFSPYNGEILYNVVLESYDTMSVNNMIVETLHPDNLAAKIFNGKYSKNEKNEIILNINNCVKKQDWTQFETIRNSIRNT